MKLVSYEQFDVFPDKLEYRCRLYFGDTYLDTFSKKNLNKFYVYARISRWIRSRYYSLQRDQEKDLHYEVMKKTVSDSLSAYEFELLDEANRFVKDPYIFIPVQDKTYEVLLLDKYVQDELILPLLGRFKPQGINETEKFRRFLINWLESIERGDLIDAQRHKEERILIEQVEQAQQEIDLLDEREPEHPV